MLIGTAVENAYTGDNFEGVAGVFWQDELLADEPIIFPEIKCWNDRNYSYVTKAGEDLYYFALDAVWRGQAQAATSATLAPVKYEYAQGVGGARA